MWTQKITILWTRLAQNTKYKIQNTKYKIQNTKHTEVGEGAHLKCEHKRSPFCDWISVHSVRTIKFTIGGGTTCGLELISGVQRVYRVCIVHEIVGVGGLFEWGGLARELRTLMEVLALVLAPRGWAVKARYEKPLCAKYIHNIHCTALKSWMWKYPDLTDKNFPCV